VQHCCTGLSQQLLLLQVVEGCWCIVQVTEVFMAVYSSLAGPQQQLTFFTLLAREFGVHGAQMRSAPAAARWEVLGTRHAAA
jgi:hypothetical protein